MTNPFKETRACESCGTPFECYITAPKRHCSHQCGWVGRKNAHHLIYTSEYSAWRDMKARCFRTTHKNYPQYGGRGITVCNRWRTSFPDFYADMGPRPGRGYSIERKDNDGDYEPSNCKWATLLEQNRNRRGTWTAEQDRILREGIAAKRKPAEVAADLEKSVPSVCTRAYRLGLDFGGRHPSSKFAEAAE